MRAFRSLLWHVNIRQHSRPHHLQLQKAHRATSNATCKQWRFRSCNHSSFSKLQYLLRIPSTHASPSLVPKKRPLSLCQRFPTVTGPVSTKLYLNFYSTRQTSQLERFLPTVSATPLSTSSDPATSRLALYLPAIWTCYTCTRPELVRTHVRGAYEDDIPGHTALLVT